MRSARKLRATARRLLPLFNLFEQFEELYRAAARSDLDLGQGIYLDRLNDASAQLVRQSNEATNDTHEIVDLGFV